MKIQNATVLVTGANRGIGRAFVDQLLARGAKRIYATARRPETLSELAREHGDRLVALPLDVTDQEQVAAAASAAADVDLVIHNAGTLSSFSLLESDVSAIEQDFATNFYGSLFVARGFAPTLGRNQNQGTLVNVLTVVSLASMPPMGGYSASKAAAWSLTQSLRGELGARGVTVLGVYPGPVDTDMAKGLDFPKTAPNVVASNALDGIEAGQADIAPDPMATEVLATFFRDPKALETQFAQMTG